jgi:hypothetical protein
MILIQLFSLVDGARIAAFVRGKCFPHKTVQCGGLIRAREKHQNMSEHVLDWLLLPPIFVRGGKLNKARFDRSDHEADKTTSSLEMGI